MDRTLKKPDRLKRLEPRTYLSFVLLLIPMMSAVMLWVALNNLGMAGDRFTDFLKTLLLPIAAFIVSYAIYRMAIEKAATLLSVGFISAGIIGAGSIMIVGTGLWVGTLPGLIIKPVEERRLQDHASQTVQYADMRVSRAAQAGRAVPVMSAIATDLDAKAACEKADSCVSLRKAGGYGDAARTLETLASRAASVRDETAAGLQHHEAARVAFADHLHRMEAVLADEGQGIWERRTALRELDPGLEQTLTRLDEAVPTTMLAAYAAELRTGVTIFNRPDLTASINALLAGYAANLETVLGKTASEAIERPVFPPRTGAIQTFAYIGEFAPIALLTFAVELVFPLTLWAYTVMSLFWERYRENPDVRQTARRDSLFDDLTGLRIVDVPERRAKRPLVDPDDDPDQPAKAPPRRGRPRSS